MSLSFGGGVAAFAGCGDDDNAVRSPDAGGDVSIDTFVPPNGDSGNDVATDADAGADAAAIVARGRYLVDHVSACPECHTPRLPSGAPDMTKYLSGAECFIDVNGPNTDGGCLNSANITNDPTGLKNRTDQQIRTMFQDGVRPDGRNLVPVMPYWSFHNMSDDDANAIVAYLRTVPGIAHTVPPNDPPFDNVPVPATAIDPTTIPPASPDGGASAQRGRYLAAQAGICLECHSPSLPAGSARPVDMTKPFAGGRKFSAAALGLSTAFPPDIYSANITPHATGRAGWAPSDFVRVIKHGKDRDDAGVCPPMPVGPMGAFGGITDQDALDIATYLVGVPPIDNTIPNGCVAP